ncbi:Bacteroidetes-specific putative membrane protein [Cecembia lonarensis LW9]|uniref:Bacteroidetes-specific putative membrane protein n=2 Tax=Cecembia TaxID=1187078 RepID=K1M4C3_CECL9|nr:Bacteroidetes-specific putative membrane protein [Cecembia lonarensis LW9]
MVMFKRSILFIFLLALCFQAIGQQLVNFSQFVFNPVFINPAYTGYKGELYLQTFNRYQWAGLEGAPRSLGFALDSFHERYGLGYGLIVRNDQVGPHRTFSLYGNLAYHLQLSNEKFLSFGASLGFSQWRLDESVLDPGFSDDPILGVGKNRMSYPDLKIGMFYYSNWGFMGFSFDNALAGIIRFDEGDVVFTPGVHLNFSAGMAFELAENHLIRPSFLFRDDFKSPASLELSSSWLYNQRIGFGVGYRTRLDYAGRSIVSPISNQVAVIGYLELFIKENLRLAYSYDYGLRQLIGNFDTHELNVSFRFGSTKKKILSPRFF